MARRTAQVFHGGSEGEYARGLSMIAAIAVLALLTLLVVLDGGGDSSA